MAPRLSRWIGMTVVAAAVVATLFLTTGGTPLFLVGQDWVWSGEQGPRTLEGRRIDGVRLARERAEARIAELELTEGLDELLARNAADPLVAEWDNGKLRPVPALTTVAERVWRILPERNSAVRTIVILDGPRRAGNIGARIDAGGRCVVQGIWDRKADAVERELRSRGGLCLFSEAFGPPGAGARAWYQGVRSGLTWDRMSVSLTQVYIAEPDDAIAPVWFSNLGSEPYRYLGGWRLREARRSEMACLVGRSELCGIAAGVSDQGWPQDQDGWGARGLQFPHAALPRDLLHSLGPARFGEVWRADASMARTYERVSGSSMDRWVQGWVNGWLGEVPRDNALSILGWVGAIGWLTLLALLTAGRFKQRDVT